MEIKNKCGRSFTHVRPPMNLWFEPKDGNGRIGARSWVPQLA